MFENIKARRVAGSLVTWSWVALSLISAPVVHAAESAATSPVTPDFALRSLTGENLRLSEFRGSVVLLGFWARWCGDCRQAMQALNEVQAKYERAGLVILGINIDDTPEQAAAMTRNLGLRYPVLIDTDKRASSQFDLKAMPLLLLIDREGQVRYRHSGFERGQEQEITEQLRQLLND